MTYPNTTYPNTPLHIDIPIKLDDVKVVFSVAALSFVGDLPWSLVHLQIITGDIADGARHLRLSWSSTAGQVTSR